MSRFKSRRDFINKSITLSLGVGLTKMSVLEEVMMSQHPNNLIKRDELKSLIQNSPQLATGKNDEPKEGCCAWDGADGMKCNVKK